MAGHNKWSKVKHIKAKEDAKKGKAFSKVGRDITIAARPGGDNPDMNPALRLAIQKARDANMPLDQGHAHTLCLGHALTPPSHGRACACACGLLRGHERTTARTRLADCTPRRGDCVPHGLGVWAACGVPDEDTRAAPGSEAGRRLVRRLEGLVEEQASRHCACLGPMSGAIG